MLVKLLRFLANEVWFAGWVWIAPKRWMDISHLRRSWSFERPAARQWHSRVLAVVEGQVCERKWGDALEIGCSEGVFTSNLSRRCRSVDAYDISPVARARAAERCAHCPNVRIGALDLATDDISGRYDLVFAMDVLSCIRGRKRLVSAVARLVSSLKTDGLLIVTDTSIPLDIRDFWGSRRWWRRWLAMMDSNEYVELLESTLRLRLVYREDYLPEGAQAKDCWDAFIALFQIVPAPGHETVIESVGGSAAGIVRTA